MSDNHKKNAEGTYTSDCNVIGSIPDYGVLMDYICEKYSQKSDSGFVFRTQNTVKRFGAAIETGILQFANERHQKLFIDAVSSDAFSQQDKLIILFWQMTYANKLFGKLVQNVFMPAVYQGRISMDAQEALNYLRFLQKEEPNSLPWSESTLETTASKYLSILKKLGLAEGAIRKTILHPVIGDSLFVYFIRWALSIEPNNRTLKNPYLYFGFYDNDSLINRLKKIELIPYWNISQLGYDIIIEIKDYE